MKIKTLDTVDGVAEQPEGKVVHPVCLDGDPPFMIEPHSEVARRGTVHCRYVLAGGLTYDKVPETWARELIKLKLAKAVR